MIQMTIPALKASHLGKLYGTGSTLIRAVRDINLTVKSGEIILIMGPSGSGKTSLLLMLGALLNPSQGSIELHGKDLAGLSQKALADMRLRQIGFIFQDFNLLSALDALENVALVASLTGLSGKEARQRAQEVLVWLGLKDRLHFLPEKLSGGEKQRVAIARALVNEPDLLLADEPTANLDSKTGHAVMRLLRQIAREKGRSVIIVSHDQRIKDIADRVLWLEDGEFKEQTLMVTDPVCTMTVEAEKAKWVEWDGQLYYFCAEGCKQEFLSNPATIIFKEPKTLIAQG